MFKTLRELKIALKVAKNVYVWCNWTQDDGDYIEVTKRGFLRSIGADTPNDGAHGGKHDSTPVAFRIEDNGTSIYIN